MIVICWLDHEYTTIFDFQVFKGANWCISYFDQKNNDKKTQKCLAIS